jgi:hypothetical protein
VQADLKAKMAEFNSQPGVVDGLKGFAAAVDWTVRFLSSACSGWEYCWHNDFRFNPNF